MSYIYQIMKKTVAFRRQVHSIFLLFCSFFIGMVDLLSVAYKHIAFLKFAASFHFAIRYISNFNSENTTCDLAFRNKFDCQQSCSQEQPLLLEELLEQEKREQEKQQQQQQQQTESSTSGSSLLSDSDFERIRADVLGATSPPQTIVPGGGVPVIRPPCTARPPSAPGTGWQQGSVPDSAKMAAAQVSRQPIATQTSPES